MTDEMKTNEGQTGSKQPYEKPRFVGERKIELLASACGVEWGEKFAGEHPETGWPCIDIFS